LLLLCLRQLAFPLPPPLDAFGVVFIDDVVLRISSRLVGQAVIPQRKKLQLHAGRNVALNAGLTPQFGGLAPVAVLFTHGDAHVTGHSPPLSSLNAVVPAVVPFIPGHNACRCPWMAGKDM
jgi:hypothetical protein